MSQVYVRHRGIIFAVAYDGTDVYAHRVGTKDDLKSFTGDDYRAELLPMGTT